MKPVEELLTKFRELDIHLWLEGESLRYRAIKEVMTPELVAELREKKGEIVSWLKYAKSAVQADVSRVVPVPRDQDLPLSITQQRFWFQSQLEPDSPINHMCYVYRFMGKLNVPVLEHSQNEMIRRHEILRTTFRLLSKQPIVLIARELSLPLPVVDLQSIPQESREAEARRLANEEVRRTFPLEESPLLRLKLLRLEEEEHILIFNMHRIICDGSSADIFFRELIALYQAFCSNQPSPLQPLPIQYVDYAYWQRQWLQGENLESQLNYWKQKLKGNLSFMELPTDYPRPPLPTYKGERCCRIFPESLGEALNELSKKSGVTLFMTLLSVFHVLLYIYTEQEETLISYSIAGREQLETEALIGPFTNTLVSRTFLAGNLTFKELLEHIKKATLEDNAYQTIPFEQLLSEIQWERTSLRCPLFQVLFALNPPWKGESKLSNIELPDLTITSLFGYVYVGQTKFDLTLVMRETDLGLRAIFEYNADLFQESTIIKMLKDFETLLEEIVVDPDREIVRLVQPVPKLNRHISPEVLNNNKLGTENTYLAPRNQLEIQLTKIWGELFGRESISIRDNFFALGGYSLLATRLFSKIEDTFAKSLPLAAIYQSPTVEQLANLMQQEGWRHPWYSLVPIQPNGDKLPLFAIHVLGQGLMYYRSLADYLGQSQPIYGLSYGLAQATANTKQNSSMEVQEIAEHYIQEMRTIQPNGPYFLMGLSAGGLIAFEMAKQLRSQGHEVGNLIMFDTINPNIKRQEKKEIFMLQKLFCNIIEHIDLELGNVKILTPRERFPYLQKRFLFYLDKNRNIKEGEEELFTRIKSYNPQPYAGLITLFKATKTFDYGDVTVSSSKANGWDDYAEKVIVYPIHGFHSNILCEPSVRILAKRLKECLYSYK